MESHKLVSLHLADRWDVYKELLDDGPQAEAMLPSVQHGFYAGASACLGILRQVALMNPTDAEGAEIMVRLSQEIVAFAMAHLVQQLSDPSSGHG